MNAPDQSTIDEIKAKVAPRDLLLIEVEHSDETHCAIATVPTKAEWLKFLAEIAGGDAMKSIQAQENLVLACSHWPARDELRALFVQKPAIASEFAGQLTSAAGLNAKASSKKL